MTLLVKDFGQHLGNCKVCSLLHACTAVDREVYLETIRVVWDIWGKIPTPPGGYTQHYYWLTIMVLRGIKEAKLHSLFHCIWESAQVPSWTSWQLKIAVSVAKQTTAKQKCHQGNNKVNLASTKRGHNEEKKTFLEINERRWSPLFNSSFQADSSIMYLCDLISRKGHLKTVFIALRQ